VAAHVLGYLRGVVKSVEQAGAGKSGIRRIVAGLGEADLRGPGEKLFGRGGGRGPGR